jgi:methylated-DNA-[protein]-cysteine S-methyltransferase
MSPRDLEAALAAAASAEAAEAAQAAARRFADAAAAQDGGADVAYAVEPSPVGDLLLARTGKGLAAVHFQFEPGDLDAYLERVSARISPRVIESPARLDDVRRQLEEYFAGERRTFDLTVDYAMAGEGFSRRILHALEHIPYGEVRSYRDAAREAGNERAVRAAGNALGANPIPIVVPCHRIVRTGGALGGYGGGPERKRFLLELEGALEARLDA